MIAWFFTAALDWILSALELGVPLLLAGLAGFGIVALGLPIGTKIRLCVLTAAVLLAYLAGWHINGRLGDAKLERERHAREVADLHAVIDAQRLRLDLYTSLSGSMATVSRGVAGIISDLNQDQADAEPSLAPLAAVCLDDPARGRAVHDHIARAAAAFGRARAARAGPR